MQMQLKNEGMQRERDKAIGARIRQAREAAGIGQAELGRMLGLGNPTSVWRYEAGDSTVPAERLEQIADLTRVSVDWLLGRAAFGGPPVGADTLRAPVDHQELLRLSRLGLQAAEDGSAEAIERFNEAVLAHARRLSEGR